MIQTINGDLLTANTGIIGHQVNCQGIMGSGVAKQIKYKWPIVYSKYRNLYLKNVNNTDKLLGKCQIVDTGDILVANIFAQEYYGYDGKQYTSYPAIHTALLTLRDYAEVHKLTVALPYKIGCDRGGGDWDKVYSYLMDIFGDSDLLTLYKLEESK